MVIIMILLIIAGVLKSLHEAQLGFDPLLPKGSLLPPLTASTGEKNGRTTGGRKDIEPGDKVN